MKPLNAQEIKRLANFPETVFFLKALVRMDLTHPIVKAGLEGKIGTHLLISENPGRYGDNVQEVLHVKEAFRKGMLDPKVTEKIDTFLNTVTNAKSRDNLMQQIRQYGCGRVDWLTSAKNQSYLMGTPANEIKNIMGTHLGTQVIRELDVAIDAVIEPELIKRGFALVREKVQATAV